MWPRQLELTLGLWLAVSPFVFRHEPERVGLWANDWFCAAAVIAIAVATHWRPLRQLHLANLLLGGWLVAFGRLAQLQAELPAHQNHLMVGLLLMMLAIVPSDANRPPRAWERFYAPRLVGARRRRW